MLGAPPEVQEKFMEMSAGMMLAGSGTIAASEEAAMVRAGRPEYSEMEPAGARAVERNEVDRLAFDAPPVVRPSIRVSREQALRDVYAEAAAKNVEIITGKDADEYLDHAARMQGLPPDAVHAINLGSELIFVRDRFAENPRVIREELIHTGQQAEASVGAGGVDSRPQQEIEARLEMIRNRHQWGITNDEVREMIVEIRQIRETGRY
jgi:hypothetical protein